MALVVGALFCYGVVHLLLMRFAVGDVYPPYSSLRSDPVGTEVLHDSLQVLPGLRVERLLDTIDDAAIPVRSLILFLSVSPNGLPKGLAPRQVDALDHAVVTGAHAFLSFVPPRRKTRTSSRKPTTAEPDENGNKKTDSGTPEDCPTCGLAERPVDLLRRWHVALFRVSGPHDAQAARPVSRQSGNAPLPSSLPWRGTHAFTDLGDEWRTIYATENGDPVLISRKFGSGRLSLATDAYVLSNEALLLDRQPGFLAWLVGNSAAVFFDETHFGIFTQPGVMTFVRGHRLHFALIALSGLAALFIWRATTSLVPPYGEESVSQLGIRSGKDSATALTNLVKRSLSPLDALEQCVVEFEKTLGRRAHDWSEKLAAARKLIQDERSRAARKRDPVACYNAIQHLFSRPDERGPDRRMETNVQCRMPERVQPRTSARRHV